MVRGLWPCSGKSQNFLFCYCFGPQYYKADFSSIIIFVRQISALHSSCSGTVRNNYCNDPCQLI